MLSNSISQLNITEDKLQAFVRRLAATVRFEAGGRQGRLVSYRKAKAPLVKLMNLAWGL